MGENQPPLETSKPSLPTARVKKIIKIDKEITRINSEAIFLISNAAELFLHFLAEESAKVAADKKRKTIKLEHLRLAVKRHQPSREFLFDSLPVPVSKPLDCNRGDRTVKEKEKEKRGASNTRRIDSFFSKRPVNENDDEEVET